MPSRVAHPARDGAVRALDRTVTSDGAPSARNLIVTVFGDAVVPCGPATEVTVQALTTVLAPFGVNERLVRTSLSRLVHDGLLAVRSQGRRSWYRLAPAAVELFADADERIYRGSAPDWDGRWTLVVLDGAESTADHRALLRQELAAAGFGSVAPNVLASPVVPEAGVVEIVGRVGGFEQVLVTRSDVVPGRGLVDPVVLARRCLGLDAVEQRYGEVVERFAPFDHEALADVDDARAAKLRLLLVAVFRRAVLADPGPPPELLPDGWAGSVAREQVARIYRAVVERSDRHLCGALDCPVSTPPGRFTGGPAR